MPTAAIIFRGADRIMTARQIGIIALAAFALVAVSGIILRPLIPIDETRYVSVAWEMHVTGGWLVPHKNGAIYTDKPPLLFWLINLVWSVTGVSDWAARIVGPLFGLATLAGTWALGRRLWDDRTGARAAAVLAGFTVFALYGGATMFDTLLSVAALLGFTALWSALMRGGGRASWIGYGLALAFGVYAKGPVILLHLLPPLLLFPLWVPAANRPSLRSVLRGAGLALAVALAVVAVWVVPAAILGGPDYREMILWKQSSGRMVSSFAHARPWYWLMVTLPLLLFPWIWSPALWRGLRRLDRTDPGIRLVALWALSGLVLFSLVSGKQVHYLLPELPAIALLFSRALGNRAEDLATPLRGIALPALLALLAGAFAIAAAFGFIGGSDAQLLRPAISVVAAVVVLVLALALALRMPLTLGMASLGLGVVLALNIGIGLTRLRQAYDARIIAGQLTGHEAQGIAIVVPKYHAEFNFPARLTEPMAELTADALPAWIALHPEGRVLSLCGTDLMPMPATQEFDFNGKSWCLWENLAP